MTSYALRFDAAPSTDLSLRLMGDGQRRTKLRLSTDRRYDLKSFAIRHVQIFDGPTVVWFTTEHCFHVGANIELQPCVRALEQRRVGRLLRAILTGLFSAELTPWFFILASAVLPTHARPPIHQHPPDAHFGVEVLSVDVTVSVLDVN